ncbi:hypothetical protein ACFWZ1_06875 [Frateuria sp. GZRe14]|uniref:hypothetical protein n=1 Tax=Frateuria sp. GZRe14 TaxID=3351534 RepID=UPI003EDC86BE
MSTTDKRFTFLLKGVGVDFIGSESLCYAPPTLPPPDDFPMMVDSQGEPVCRYGDHKWRIGTRPFNFGTDPGDLGSGHLVLTKGNGELLKRCIAWFMYGDRRGVTTSTLHTYYRLLKPIFAFCSGRARPIVASDLSRFFDTLAVPLARAMPLGSAKYAMRLLNELWLAREHLGFTLVDPKQIAHLTQLIPEHEVRQTQFIPPRIWAYQAGQLQACLEDFLAHKTLFETALRDILAAYRCNFGSLANMRRSSDRNPFNGKGTVRGCTYLGSFSSFADHYGIRDVLARWLLRPGTEWDEFNPNKTGLRTLARYFGAIGLVGMAYLQCFSGMRRSESQSLRCNCLTVEHDPLLGDIHILSGETTKTTEDDDARWLAAPTVALAVEAMSIVARWRTSIAVERADVPLTREDKTNPYLLQRRYEPWACGPAAVDKHHPTARRPQPHKLSSWESMVPGLFEEDALRITEDDASYVRRFSANADTEKYGEGCVWNFTSHQYRRTVAVMMGASQVSLESQQYQFKHLTRNQSAYYRRGFQSLRLNRTFSYELVQTRYELVSVELGLLNGPEYVSPISTARKDEILNFHDVGSGDALQKAIKKGQLAVKQTLFGVCTRRDSCPYGGHDNYAHCPDCNDALLSKRKRSSVEKLGKTIAIRLVDVPLGTPLRTQLERSSAAIERFMDVTA